MHAVVGGFFNLDKGPVGECHADAAQQQRGQQPNEGFMGDLQGEVLGVRPSRASGKGRLQRSPPQVPGSVRWRTQAVYMPNRAMALVKYAIAAIDLIAIGEISRNVRRRTEPTGCFGKQ